MRECFESEHRYRDLEMSPFMEAIVDGDYSTVSRMLEEGTSPSDEIAFFANRGERGRDELHAVPLEIAIGAREFEIAKCIIDHGADLSDEAPGYLYRAIKADSFDLFCYLLEAGIPVKNERRHIWLVFQALSQREHPESYLGVLDDLDFDYANEGGEALRGVAWADDMASANFLIKHGADVNYHEPDMVHPYGDTPLCVAAYKGHAAMVRFLVERGADATIANKRGDRPYTMAVQEGHEEIAEFLKEHEPPEWHNQQEKERTLKSYKLPAELVRVLKEGPRRIEFPQGDWAQWAEYYNYLDTVEFRRSRRKYLSLIREIDRYGSEYIIAWCPRDKKIWYFDDEHGEAHPMASWDDFSKDPGAYINGIFNGDYANGMVPQACEVSVENSNGQ